MAPVAVSWVLRRVLVRGFRSLWFGRLRVVAALLSSRRVTVGWPGLGSSTEGD